MFEIFHNSKKRTKKIQPYNHLMNLWIWHWGKRGETQMRAVQFHCFRILEMTKEVCNRKLIRGCLGLGCRVWLCSAGGSFLGQGICSVTFFFFERFCILIVVVVTFVKTQLSTTMSTFCSMQILRLESCCLHEFTLCTGAFWVWGPAGVLQGSHTPMKLGLILSPDSFRCLHIVCVCVCVCVYDDT